ncbi:hypothetical protein D3C76_1064060 [compost metagenome]
MLLRNSLAVLQDLARQRNGAAAGVVGVEAEAMTVLVLDHEQIVHRFAIWRRLGDGTECMPVGPARKRRQHDHIRVRLDVRIDRCTAGEVLVIGEPAINRSNRDAVAAKLVLERAELVDVLIGDERIHEHIHIVGVLRPGGIMQEHRRVAEVDLQTTKLGLQHRARNRVGCSGLMERHVIPGDHRNDHLNGQIVDLPVVAALAK